MLVWLTLNRAYPAKTQARMGAVLSSAWILPSLVGPALAGIIGGVELARGVPRAAAAGPMRVMADFGAPDPYRCASRAGARLEQDAVGSAIGRWNCVTSLRASAELVGGDCRIRDSGRRSLLACATPNTSVRNVEVAPRAARSTWYARLADLCILRSPGVLPTCTRTGAWLDGDGCRRRLVGRLGRMDLGVVAAGLSQVPFQSRREAADHAVRLATAGNRHIWHFERTPA